MFYIRTTKTASGSTAVQVVRYENRQKIIVAHIGSARNAKELSLLKQNAAAWIEKTTRQQKLRLFHSAASTHLIPLDKCKYLGVRYSFIYEVLSRLFTVFKFHLLRRPLLTDLALIRIVEPTSKLRSVELLKEYFGIQHQRRNLYRQIPVLAAQKNHIESQVLTVARKQFNFDFSLVFYDVTTLYFESGTQDELRRPGFSKDFRAHKPQILIGLVVNAKGFPIAYEIFEGNKFEGHTIIPIITALQRRHRIKQLTVVADAAMLSIANMQALQKNGLRYIVGARIGNLPDRLTRKINLKLKQIDGASQRFTSGHGILICDFSATRFRKDKHEMEKQIRKARFALQDPSKMKRLKFVKNVSHSRYQLNTELIEKTKLLLGIKGYYTNLPSKISNDTIINHYHNLWHIEQAFRIAKNDLRIRPMYHFKKQAIQTHILICFMALAISKYIEIKTGRSIKSVIKTLKSVTDARILNTLTEKEVVLRSEIQDDTKQILKQLGVWY